MLPNCHDGDGGGMRLWIGFRMIDSRSRNLPVWKKKNNKKKILREAADLTCHGPAAVSTHLTFFPPEGPLK
jgi:hypothetical protein